MSKFVTKHISSVKGKQKFKQLIIVPDNEDAKQLQAEIDKQESQQEEIELKGELDIYEESLEKKYSSSFRSMIAIMNRVANLQAVPKEKFRDVTPKKETVAEYEFKFQDLRVLAIKIPNGQLILLGGYKNQQSSDFKKFRSLKKQYLESLNQKK